MLVFTFLVATHNVQIFELLGETWVESNCQCQICKWPDGYK